MLAEARRYADEAVALDATTEYVYFARGLVYAVARNRRSLLRTAEQLLDLDPPAGSVALGG